MSDNLGQFLPSRVPVSETLVDWYKRRQQAQIVESQEPESESSESGVLPKVAHPIWDVSSDGMLERKQSETAQRVKTQKEEQVPNMLGAKVSTTIGGKKVAGRIVKCAKDNTVVIQLPNGMRLSNIEMPFVEFE